jgi:hypothetical protein
MDRVLGLIDKSFKVGCSMWTSCSIAGGVTAAASRQVTLTADDGWMDVGQVGIVERY